MKSQQLGQSRSTLTKKPSTKILIEKKNSVPVIESTLKKQKSKPNLIINNYHDTVESNTVMNVQKVVSPKNIISSTNNAIVTGNVKKELIDEHVIQHEKLLISNKKTTQGNKIKKADLSKKQPIKKQSLTTLRSPKSSKSNTTSTIQSQVFIKQFQPFTKINQYEQLSISMNTSIVKTEQQLQQSIVLSNSNFSDRKQQPQEISFVKQHMGNSILALKQKQIQELKKVGKQQSEEIAKLKEVNEGLERKYNKMKLAQDQNKRKLRQRITVFDEEGEEIKHLSEKIVLLEKQIQSLLLENTSLKNKIKENTLNIINQSQQQILKESSKKIDNYSIFQAITLQILPQLKQSQNESDSNTKKNITMMIDQSVMTGLQDSAMSSINGNNSVGILDESVISMGKFGAYNKELLGEGLEQSEQVISGLLGIRDLYEDKCREKLQLLQGRYSQYISDIQQRITLFIAQSKQIINQQQSQITYLQSKLDQLYQRIQQSSSTPSKSTSFKPFPHVYMDQQLLLHMSEINSYRNKLAQKDQLIKRTKQQLHNVEIQLKSVYAQRDIQRIKHSLSCQFTIVKKEFLNMSESERYDMLHEQLRCQKQRNAKLLKENIKKQQLIRKLSVAHHQQSTSGVNKKIRK